MNPNDTVYVGSLWHRDCDRFATVVGFDEQVVSGKLAELARSEISTKGVSDICSAGVHTRDIPVWLDDVALAELETGGITTFQHRSST